MVPPQRHYVGSNDYEEPRPPRRGSHRPAQEPTRPLSLWSYGDTSDGYFHEQQTKPRDFLPSKRYAPYSRETSCGYGTPARTSLAPPRRCQSSPASAGGIGTTAVQSPLDRLQHFKGCTPDRYSLEKSILESYVRAAPQSAACQIVQKRCMFPSCTKISVSRGLCRGHGGGRRCHVPDCTKSAQSRSNFCWAHGGGQRCEADHCMRSRKSKHFCVAHLHLDVVVHNEETTKPRGRLSNSGVNSQPNSAPRALPSLGQALSSASRSPPNLPERGSFQPLRLASTAL